MISRVIASVGAAAEYREKLRCQSLGPVNAEQLPPWQDAFRSYVCSMKRLDRLTLNLTLKYRLPIRDRFARQFLRGNGVEIGAQNVPTSVAPDLTSMEYVDAFTNEHLHSRYGLDPSKLVPITHILDAADLAAYADGEKDFLIANHVLEHFDDPVGGLVEWLRIIKQGGHLFLTLPNYRANCYDFRRTPESREHLILDYTDAIGRRERNFQHYKNMAASMYDRSADDPVSDIIATQWVEAGDRHHYHVYDEKTLRTLVDLASKMTGIRLIIDGAFMLKHGFELLLVIKKGGPGKSGEIKWPSKSRLSVTSRLTLIRTALGENRAPT